MADSTASHDAHARIAELESELRNERAQIAELKAALKNERAQYALAERAARVGYWRLTLPDFRKTWSPGMYALVGMEPGSPIPAVEALFHKDDAGGVRSYLDKRNTAIRTLSSMSERARIHCADGSYRTIDTLAKIETGPNGDAVAIVGVCHDVTQQIAIEAERDEAEELRRIMTEAASDIIMVHDVQGKAEFASAALGRILGLTLGDMERDEFYSRVHPDDLAEAVKFEIWPGPGQSITATYRIQCADGRYLWLETTTRSVYDETTGEFRHIVGVSRDVSERKAQELEMQAACAAAEAASRAKSTFLANMSHELRTPLNAVIGFTDMMVHEVFGPLDNPHYRGYVSLIHQAGEHLLDLINDILDMAKIEAGKFELNLEEMNLAETVEECIRTMAERAASAGVEVNVALPAQGVTCRADRRAMKQIVLNLLSNAVKFTPCGGHVEIAATIEGDLIRMEIRDDGIGIAARDLPRLAKPFEQVCVDPNLTKSGTGLGLALVRALTDQHGGRFTIDSPAQKGTIVTVEFPRYAKAHVAAAQILGNHSRDAAVAEHGYSSHR